MNDLKLKTTRCFKNIEGQFTVGQRVKNCIERGDNFQILPIKLLGYDN